MTAGTGALVKAGTATNDNARTFRSEGPPGNPTREAASTPATTSQNALSALCTIARFHQIAADPSTLAHQLGISSNDPLTPADLLRAAQHLGLKAKLSRSVWP